MSTQKIQFTQDQLISFFTASGPPENHSEFLPVFSAECQEPLDQSLFTNNWRPKQQYYRPNNRNITLGGSSSTSFGTANSTGDNQQAPIQNTSSTPLSTFSPLRQESNNQQNPANSDIQYTNSQNKNFHPPTFQPANIQNTNFQPAPFQPTSPMPANFQPAPFQPTNPMPTNFQPAPFHPVNPMTPSLQTANFQPTNSMPPNYQTANFQPTALPVSNFQPTVLHNSNFQPINPQAMNFHPAYQYPNNFQSISPPPPIFQPKTFQPTYPQTPTLQPTNYQPTDQFQQVIQQPDISYNQAFQNSHYIPQQIPDPQFTQQVAEPQFPQQVPDSQFQQQDHLSYQNIQSNEELNAKDENENNEKYSQEEEQEQPNKDFVYFKPKFESFESVIGEQNDEKAEEEAKQKQLQEQEQIHQSWINSNNEIQNQQPDMNKIIADQQYAQAMEEEDEQRQQQEQQQQQQESWVNNKEKQNHQPSMNDIIADQKVISSIEAQQRQEQYKIQQQQKNKSSVGSWADTNVRSTSSKPTFEDIFDQEKSKENKQQKQMPKVPKGSGKGKVTKMSFQDLQREMSKPSQWGEQVMNPPVPSISNIIASTESQKPASNTNVPQTVGKGKKSKKKKEVFDYQEFCRMNEEQHRAKNEAIWANSAKGGSTGKSFSTISTEALIESEKNRQSFPAPTSAPVQKRANHRGRGKDLAAQTNVAQTRLYNYDEEEEDYYYQPKQVQKQSFDSITNSEMAKQNKNQNQTKTNQNTPASTTTTTNTNTTNTGTTSKKKKQKYQIYQDTNQPQTSTWGAVSGSVNKTSPTPATTTAKKQVDFSQLQQNEKADQTAKSANSKPAASNVSAVQPKKKKKTKKILYIDNYIKNHQENATPYNYDDESFSDDDDYYYQQNSRPTKAANTTNFMELLNNEQKNKKKDDQQPQQNVHISSFAAKKTLNGNQNPSFEALTKQEIDRQQAAKIQPQPINNVRKSQKGFENLLKDEKEMKDAVIGGDVQIIDDNDIRIPGKKEEKQQPKVPQNQPKPKKAAKKSNQNINNDDLFWGRATKTDDYVDDTNQVYEEDDVFDDNEQFFGGSKPKAGNERASYLKHLIEMKLGSQDDDLYDFANEIINKDRNGMIYSLRTLLDDGDAKNVAASFFKKYPK